MALERAGRGRKRCCPPIAFARRGARQGLLDAWGLAGANESLAPARRDRGQVGTWRITAGRVRRCGVAAMVQVEGRRRKPTTDSITGGSGSRAASAAPAAVSCACLGGDCRHLARDRAGRAFLNMA